MSQSCDRANKNKAPQPCDYRAFPFAWKNEVDVLSKTSNSQRKKPLWHKAGVSWKSKKMVFNRKYHWEKYWEKYSIDVARRATHVRSAQIGSNLIEYYFRNKQNELRILDLGCGSGNITRLLHDFLSEKGYKVYVTGIDISENALKKFGREYINSLSAILGDASRLPFHSKYFDAVVSFGYGSVASYYAPQIQHEIHRILKPSGILISDFRNILSLYFLVLKPYHVIKMAWRFLGFGKKVPYFFSELGIRKYFAKSGFKLCGITFTNTFPPLSTFFSESTLIRFDMFTHKTPLGRLLGRIFIALFVKLSE